MQHQWRDLLANDKSNHVFDVNTTDGGNNFRKLFKKQIKRKKKRKSKSKNGCVVTVCCFFVG